MLGCARIGLHDLVMATKREYVSPDKEAPIEMLDTPRSAETSLPWPGPKATPGLSPMGYQELLEAFERLQEKNSRRTVALASAAHELKTPLAVMAGYLDVLLSQKSGPLSEHQQRILRDMQTNRVRLQRFIDDFLISSALEGGKLNMRFEHGDLNACLSEIYTLWLARFKSKKIAFYFPMHDKLEPFSFDYYKTQRVLSNLLENSLKFTPSGGSVWLSAAPDFWERRNRQERWLFEERRWESTAAMNSVHITVSDTGVGIAPENQQEIFDEFVRLAQPEHESEGIGLGLAIARRLVQAHGGKSWVESEPGSGSKFSFLLPRKPA